MVILEVSPVPARRPQSRRSRRLTALTLAVGLLVPGCGNEGYAQTSPEPQSEAPRASAAEDLVTDAELSARIERILRSTGWFGQADVVVRDGIVFLDGVTDAEEHRRWAGDLAAGRPGTVAVVNRLRIEGDVGSTFSRAGEESARLYQRAVQAWPLVLLAFVIALTTWLVAALVGRLTRLFLAPRISSPLLRTVIVRAVSIPVFLLGIYFLLQVAGLTRLAITVLGGTGIIGIVIGFAFRDIAENFLASLLLSIRNPFRSGDLIDVAGHLGVVQNLNTRSTVMLTLDGNHVQIPNAMVFKSIIKNYSSIPSRRAEFTVGIGYDSSTAEAQALIAGVLHEHPAVLVEPEPLVLVDQLGAATVDLRVQYWFDSATYSPARINSALLRLTKNALVAGGIEMPDPAREVVFPKGVPIMRAAALAPGSTQIETEPTPPPTGMGQEAVTRGEGDLRRDTPMAGTRPEDDIPESRDNLLSP
jgi:small conductance mechanosensitive channel